jgi:hypothetical protein
MSDERSWCVDYEVEAEVTLSKTIKVTRSEIYEAASAEEAVQLAHRELYLDASDIDTSQLNQGLK